MGQPSMKTVKFKVIGKSWTLRVLDSAHYDKKKARKGSVAITYSHKRRIDLSPDGMDVETITHEIYHSYCHELCISSSRLDVDAMEEFCAELISKRGQEIIDLGKLLFKKISE